MTAEFVAAWLPFRTDRTPAEAAAVAIRWADRQAASNGGRSILVVDRKSDITGDPQFEPFLRGRCASLRSRRVEAVVGAVIAYLPTPDAIELATSLARRSALVVVEHPSPWRLTGWAGMVGAVDLEIGEVTEIDPRLREHIERLSTVGHNGYGPQWDRDRAQSFLREIAADGLLDRELVLGGLAALNASTSAQQVIEKLIARIAPSPSDA